MSDPVLIHAAIHGDLATVQRCVVHGRKFREADFALSLAAENGHLACVEVLVPFVVGWFKGGEMALFQAAHHGHAACVVALLPVVTDEKARNDALNIAATRGHLDCLLALLPVSDARARTSRPVGEAAEGGHLACLEALIPVSCSRGLGRALAMAAMKGKSACMERLLEVAPVKEAWDHLRKRGVRREYDDEPEAWQGLDRLAPHVTARVWQKVAAEHPPGTFPAMEAMLRAQRLQGELQDALPAGASVAGRRRRM